MSKRELTLFLIISMMWILPCRAQKGTSISGIVKEKSTGESLPYAAVTAESTGKGTITNNDGYFTLHNLPEGELTITVQYLGYRKQSVTWKSKQAGNRLIVIELETDSRQLNEVVVAGKQNMLKVSDNISQVMVSPRQLSALPGVGEKDIFRSLQLLPGISGSNETSSGLYVRGGTPDQNLILYDGFTVYHVDHFYGFFSAFNANAIKDVQLYKGGFEPRFGGRTSSVVEITGKTGNEQQFNMGGEISSISANVFTEIPLAKKGSILFAARRSFTEIIKSQLYQDIFNMAGNEKPARQGNFSGRRNPAGSAEPVFHFYDLNLKGTWKPSENDVISVSFYTGKDKLDNTIDRQSTGRFMQGTGSYFNVNTTDLTQWGNHGASARWAKKLNDRWYSNAVLSFSNFFSDRDRATTVFKSDSEQDQQNFGFVRNNNVDESSFRNDWEYSLSTKHRVGFGLNLTRSRISFDNEVNDSTALKINSKGMVSAIYAQDKWSPVEKLTLTGGLRFSFFDQTSRFYPEPRLQALCRLKPGLSMKAAWGIYNQFINRSVQEDIENGSQEIWLLSDDELIPVQRATHYIVGVSYDRQNWLFDIEAYYKDMSGLSELNTRIGSRRKSADDQQDIYANSFFEGTGYAKGIELLIQRKAGRYTGWVGYTLSEVIHSFPDISEHDFPALHDQTHELKLVNAYEWRRWSLAATWVYGTGKPYTAPEGGYYLNLPDGTRKYYITVGEKNASRLPDYSRLDLSATYNFNLGTAPASFGLSVFNVYNRSNIWYKDYTIDTQNEIFETVDVTYLGVTPTLFFSVRLK